jgi:hypothetical protein
MGGHFARMHAHTRNVLWARGLFDRTYVQQREKRD